MLKNRGKPANTLGPGMRYEVGWAVQNEAEYPVALTAVSVDFQTPGAPECSTGEYQPEILDSPERFPEPIILAPGAEAPEPPEPFFNDGFVTPDWTGKDCQGIRISIPLSLDAHPIDLAGASEVTADPSDMCTVADETTVTGENLTLGATWQVSAPGVPLPTLAGTTEFFVDEVSVGSAPVVDGTSSFTLSEKVSAGTHEVTAQLHSDLYGSAADAAGGDGFTTASVPFRVAEQLPSSCFDAPESRLAINGSATQDQVLDSDGQQRFTASWAAADAAPDPSGLVQFTVDGHAVGSGVELHDGSAEMSMNDLVQAGEVPVLFPPGEYTLEATLSDPFYGELAAQPLPFRIAQGSNASPPGDGGANDSGEETPDPTTGSDRSTAGDALRDPQTPGRAAGGSAGALAETGSARDPGPAAVIALLGGSMLAAELIRRRQRPEIPPRNRGGR